MKIIKELFSTYKYSIFFFVLSFFAVQPLLHAGFPPTHDGEYHIIRFYEFDKVLREGVIYPRWAPDLNNGFGVPLFNYVYPLPNYIASFLYFLGLNFIDGFKVSLLLATLVGGIFLYLWSRLFWGEVEGLVAAVFYTYAPYRFVDIYVRGSVGELWALAFFPGFLWGVSRLVLEGSRGIRWNGRNRWDIVLTGIFLSLVIYSHNILALMFVIFGILYAVFLILYQKNKRVLLIQLSLALLIGICISAIFWLPALSETKYVQGLQIYSIDNNFPELYQLLIPSWGTGFAGSGENEMSLQVGVVNLLVVLVSLGIVVRSVMKRVISGIRGIRESTTGIKGITSITGDYIMGFFLVWFFWVVFFMLPISKSLWHSIPFFSYFQFPWRFLSLIIIICSFLAGGVVGSIRGRKARVGVSILLILFAILSTIGYTKPAYYHNRDDTYYITRDNFIHGTNSPGNSFRTIWMEKILPIAKERFVFVGGEGKSRKLGVIKKKVTEYTITVDSKKDTITQANIAYFPGWEVFVDGRKVPTTITKTGLFSFVAPRGKHTVSVVFNDTMVRRVGGILTVLGMGMCIGLLKVSRVIKQGTERPKDRVHVKRGR